MGNPGVCPTCSWQADNLEQHLAFYHRVKIVYQCLCGYTEVPKDKNYFKIHIEDCIDAELGDDLANYKVDVREFRGLFYCKVPDCGFQLLDMESMNKHYKKCHPGPRAPSRIEALIRSTGDGYEEPSQGAGRAFPGPSSVDDSAAVTEKGTNRWVKIFLLTPRGFNKLLS